MVRSAIVSEDEFIPRITVRDIFLDNDNWARYFFLHKDELRDVEITEVEKMLRCHADGKGFFYYYCPHCDSHWIVSNGCNSRICSDCGKRYTDKWAKRLSSKMFNVVHRHLVLTVPHIIWYILRDNKSALKAFMDSGIKAINQTLSYIQREDLLGGAIVILHPYGKDMEFKPHLHVLMVEGGFDKSGRFIRKKFIPFEVMRKTWQYHVLTALKRVLPKSRKYRRLIDACFKKYKNGFVIHMPEESRIRSKRTIAQYIGRYVRHPAIANTRISEYDGRNVTFWYFDRKKDVKVSITVSVEEFIRRVIQHIPERQFKMIRYYGAYCRKWKKRFQRYLSQESIPQRKLWSFTQKRCFFCPACGAELRFEGKTDNPPPDRRIFGGRITDWANLEWGRASSYKPSTS